VGTALTNQSEAMPSRVYEPEPETVDSGLQTTTALARQSGPWGEAAVSPV